MDQHFARKAGKQQLEITFNLRLLEIRVCKKVLLKVEILSHYQNSRFFRTYANSNKMSGPLHVRINGCILYLFNDDNTSFLLFPFLKVIYVLQGYDQLN